MSGNSNAHRVQIIIAIIGLIGTIAAALIANWDKIFSRSEKPVIETRLSPDDQTAPIPKVNPPPPPQPQLTGTYTGYSIEGATRYPIRITLQRTGNRVTGSYVQAGQRGTVRGTVTGNKLRYEWILGGYQGQGVSIIDSSQISGTWGYGNSVDNGGTLYATAQ